MSYSAWITKPVTSVNSDLKPIHPHYVRVLLRPEAVSRLLFTMPGAGWFFEAVALTDGRHDAHMVQQPIEQRGGERCILSKRGSHCRKADSSIKPGNPAL